MKNKDKIKQIWFDWGRVLIDLDFENWLKRFEKVGVKDLKSQLKQSVFWEYEKGLIKTADFRNEVKHICGLNCQNEEFDYMWNSLLNGIPNKKLDYVAQLHTQYHTALLSNTNELHWHYGAKDFIKNGRRMEDFFDHLFLSFEMKLAKPQPEFFEEVIRKSGAIPHETLFIDDLTANCEAARAAGLQVIEYQEGADLRNVVTIYLEQ